MCCPHVKLAKKSEVQNKAKKYTWQKLNVIIGLIFTGAAADPPNFNPEELHVYSNSEKQAPMYF